MRAVGRNRVLVNKQAVTRRRDYARAPARHGVLTRRPRGREGRSGAPARLPRRAARGRAAPRTASRPHRLRTGPQATQRAAARRESATPKRARRSTCSTTAWRWRAASSCAVDCALVDRLTPGVAEAYESLGGGHAGGGVALRGRVVARTARRRTGSTTWSPRCVARWRRLRKREMDRGVTLVGPHRDDCRLVLDGLDARSHASQGEQRTLALALRLAGPPADRRRDRGATRCSSSTTCSASSTRTAPPRWSRTCPATQTLLTTAGVVPPGSTPSASLTRPRTARSDRP